MECLSFRLDGSRFLGLLRWIEILGLFWKGNSHLIADFHKTELDFLGLFREGKSPFCS